MGTFETGAASGWHVDPPAEDGGAWRWRAYAPAGARSGEADDREAAEAAAQEALADLLRPVERSG